LRRVSADAERADFIWLMSFPPGFIFREYDRHNNTCQNYFFHYAWAIGHT
jgi:hypothetical protein